MTQNSQSMENMDVKNMCHYCHKIFSRSDSLARHIDKSCRARKSLDDSKEKMFQKLLIEHNELIKRIDILEKENKKYKHVVKNNIQIQNNVFNIKMIPFGKEDISSITNRTYKQIIDRGFMSIPAFVEKIHFDKNKPEFQNIYISNMRDDYILVFDGNDWKLSNKTDTLDTLYNEKFCILENKFQELIDDLPENVISKFRRFLNKSDDDNTKNGIKKELKLILYNHRKLVENTRKSLQQP